MLSKFSVLIKKTPQNKVLKKAGDTCRITRAKGQINGFNSPEDIENNLIFIVKNIILFVGLIVGLIISLYAINKYNKGIF